MLIGIYPHRKVGKVIMDRTYKVKDIHNKVYLTTKDILQAQLEVLNQTKKQGVKPLDIFIAVVKTA